MKNQFLFPFLIIFFLLMSPLSPQYFQWASSMPGHSTAPVPQGNGIATDYAGNIFVCGQFKHSIDFGGGIKFTTNANNTSPFIARYDAQGNCIWAKKGTGYATDMALGIVTDSAGYSYVTGIFDSDSIFFGNLKINRNGSNDDVFIVKVDPNGDFIWAKSAGGILGERSESISMDKLGHIYIGGRYSGSATFDDKIISSVNGSTDAFLAKYDTSGNCIWVKSGGGTGSDFIRGVSTDPDGYTFITGSIGSAGATFGTSQIGSYGNLDIFVCLYDPIGNCVWAKHGGGSAGDYGLAVSTANGMGCFITGYAAKPGLGANIIYFDQVQLTPIGSHDIFIAKYNLAGEVVWAKLAGAPDYDRGHGIFTPDNNQVYVTGFCADPALFDTVVVHSVENSWDPIIAYYTGSQECKFVRRGGGNAEDVGLAITGDRQGNIYITGYCSSNIGFFDADSVIMGAFVAKLVPTGTNVNDDYIPGEYALSQNYPNPFNPVTVINYQTGVSSHVTLKLFDVLGKEVATIVNGEKSSGRYEVQFDATGLSSGVYFYRLQAGKYIETKKMMVVK